jgi:hypothetical protein
MQAGSSAVLTADCAEERRRIHPPSAVPFWRGHSITRTQSQVELNRLPFTKKRSASGTRVHVAFSGDWNDDMYTLAHDDFARRHASQVLDVRESRRFVFRRNEGEDELACRMVDCRKPPWVPTEVQCSSSELYAVEHVRRDGPPRQHHWPGALAEQKRR